MKKIQDFKVEFECTCCHKKISPLMIEATTLMKEDMYKDCKTPEELIEKAYGNKQTQITQGTWLCEHCGNPLYISCIKGEAVNTTKNFTLKQAQDFMENLQTGDLKALRQLECSLNETQQRLYGVFIDILKQYRSLILFKEDEGMLPEEKTTILDTELYGGYFDLLHNTFTKQFERIIEYDTMSPKCFCNWGLNDCLKSEEECQHCQGNSKNIDWL